MYSFILNVERFYLYFSQAFWSDVFSCKQTAGSPNLKGIITGYQNMLPFSISHTVALMLYKFTLVISKRLYRFQKILSSTTVFNIDNKSAYYNDFWRIVTLNTRVMMLKVQLCITWINYILTDLHIENRYFKLKEYYTILPFFSVFLIK